MNVSDIMTYRPYTVGAEATAQYAAQQMRANVVGVLPVVEDGRIVGVVTDRDLVVRSVARGEVPWEVRVRDVMTPGPAVCAPEEPLSRVVDRMIARRVRRIVVIDAAGVAGVLSLDDLALYVETQPLALRLLAHLAAVRGGLDGGAPRLP
jgi:CBS domain-containing protein